MMAKGAKEDGDISTIRRLSTIVATDFLVWFSLGCLSLLSAAGVSVPAEINEALALMAVPLNSALNPFLYVVGKLTEKRRTTQLLKMMKLLEASVRTRENRKMGARAMATERLFASDSCFISTTEEALKLLSNSLLSNVDTLDDINAYLLTFKLRMVVPTADPVTLSQGQLLQLT